jgi:hypothetical protein
MSLQKIAYLKTDFDASKNKVVEKSLNNKN